ncbi:MAG: acyltransferase family protein [Acidimicrobiales bacterium]|nr:acyltransferase family protein [Acidimicrobiales bacterium]
MTSRPDAPAREPTAARADHLWQVDIVRLLTFSAVISVHSMAFTQSPGDPVAAGVMMLLQYGREVFFALTGFVLVYSSAGRIVRARPFWSRRIAWVAVPYVAWTAIYYWYDVVGPQHVQPSVSGFMWDLLYGGAEYHLYFLLVTLQVYLLFPLILRFVRRTAHRAVPVLAGVTVLNLGLLAILQYTTTSIGWLGWFYLHAYELLPTYSMYVLAGCYAAVHFSKIQAMVNDRTRWLLKIAGVAGAAALAGYTLQLLFEPPRVADDVLQPAMVFSCIAAAIAVYVIGSRWAQGPRRHQQTIQVLSDASFGVYLSHPFVLQLLLDHGLGNGQQVVPAPVATLIAFVASAAGGTVISLLARRTPLSLALTGRAWRPTPARDRAAPPIRLPFRLRPGPAPALALVPATSAYPMPTIDMPAIDMPAIDIPARDRSGTDLESSRS